MPIDAGFSSARRDETSEDFHGRGLPRSVGTEQTYEFAFVDVEADVVYGY